MGWFLLLLSRRDVEELPNVDALIDAPAGAMVDLSAGPPSVRPLADLTFGA
jgi:hypothetical protein